MLQVLIFRELHDDGIIGLQFVFSTTVAEPLFRFQDNFDLRHRVKFLLRGAIPVCLLFSGCSAVPNSYTAEQLFPTQAASWTMVNAQGKPTFFQLRPVQNVGCQAGNSIDLFITKNDPDTYWDPGLANASVHWIVHQNSNGQWNAIASLIHWDNPDPAWGFGQDMTVNYIAQSQNAYLVVPSLFLTNQQTTVTGYAQWYLDRNHQTNECLVDSGEQGQLFRWTSKFYLQNVTTPIYSGSAVVNDEFEGCSSSDQETEDSKACAHEKWYFAPKLGLVEIDSIWEGITLKRTTK